MTKVTTNKLVDLLRRSNLVDEAKLAAFLEKAASTHGEAALENQNRLAELLIEEGLITRWQADKLLAGKHKGFRLCGRLHGPGCQRPEARSRDGTRASRHQASQLPRRPSQHGKVARHGPCEDYGR